MPGEPWILAAFVLMTLLNLGVILYWRRRAGSGTGELGLDAAVPGDGNADGVENAVCCPDCGATNERGYHYCRQCAGELGRAGRSASPGSDSNGVF